MQEVKSQTEGTATAEDIIEGKTAWVDGKLITGNMSSNNVAYFGLLTRTQYGPSTNWSNLPMPNGTPHGFTIDYSSLSVQSDSILFLKDMTINMIFTTYYSVDSSGKETMSIFLDDTEYPLAVNEVTASKYLIKELNVKKGSTLSIKYKKANWGWMQFALLLY